MDDFTLNPIVDFCIRLVITGALLYFLFALLDHLYRGNNRHPRVFNAIDRGVDWFLGMLFNVPFGGPKGLDLMSRLPREGRTSRRSED